MNEDSGFYSSYMSNERASYVSNERASSCSTTHTAKRKRKNTKHAFNVYYIGCCTVPVEQSTKLLSELAQEAHQRIISTMPDRALLQKKVKARVSEKCIRWKKEKHYMEDIGHCNQFGSSVLFMVKRPCGRIRAYSVFCQGIVDASKLFDIISLGYQSAQHPNFTVGDPWCTEIEPEFFDDSLQDQTFYNRPQSLMPFGSLLELSDMFYPKHCFSLDDISNINTLYREPVMSSSRASLSNISIDSMLAVCESDRESMVVSDSGLELEQGVRERKVHVVKPVVRVARVVQRVDNYVEKEGEGVKKIKSNSFKQRRKSVSNV